MARTFSNTPEPHYVERAKEVDDINITAKVENCTTTGGWNPHCLRGR